MDISIKKPCHENWSEMTPNEQGAFCGKCVKTVIDFSNKSVEEIKNFFTTKQEEKVCGRFEKTQLISLSFDSFFNEFRRFDLTRRFAVILYFTFGMGLFNSSSLSAQVDPAIKGDVAIIHPVGDGKPVIQEDTIKPCKKPDNEGMIMGKIMAPKPKPEEKTKMGEVRTVDPKNKVGPKPGKPLPKK